jgi:single-stranded DNA-binding protein
MTAQLSAHGRLVTDVQQRTTAKGEPMALTRMACSVPCRDNDSGEETIWISLMAFGRTADKLLRSQKGENISCMGQLQLNNGWTLLCNDVVTARTTRPGASQKHRQQQGTHSPGAEYQAARKAQDALYSQPGDNSQPYNDEVTF